MRFLVVFLWMLTAVAASGETVRVATWAPDLSRKGPGLLLRDISAGKDPQVAAAVAVLRETRPDILLLTGIDWDYQGTALAAFAERLRAEGADYPYLYAPKPNTGVRTGLDLDGNGRLGEPRDAQGYGRFPGQDGMALMSRLPLGAARDFTGFLWADLPGAQTGEIAPAVRAIQRLSTTGHWDVPVLLPSGDALHLLAYSATPPAFEPRNIARNHDETAFWLRYLEGALPEKPASAPFVILGKIGTDPEKGDGRREALLALLARVQDPLSGRDTVDYGGKTGALRADYVLPSPGLRVLGAGIGPAGSSRHHLVWVDISLR